MTSIADSSSHTTTLMADGASRTPTGRVLTATLIIAPVGYLAADTAYAALGWDAPVAAVIHVLAAIAYGLVAIRIAGWLRRESWLATALLVVGALGTAGNIAYGFDTIHVSLGAVSLVDQSGAATLIKPLGLFFPLALILSAVALWLLRRRWQAVVIVIAGLVWPVGHIVNIAPVAVVTNVALVLAFGSLIWQRVGVGSES